MGGCEYNIAVNRHLKACSGVLLERIVGFLSLVITMMVDEATVPWKIIREFRETFIN